MGNLYITVEEFMKQIGNSHGDVEPSVYSRAAMELSNATVSHDDKNKELVFYYGCNASLIFETDNIYNISSMNEESYVITLDDGLAFNVTKTPEIK